jgi:hypothetical protein
MGRSSIENSGPPFRIALDDPSAENASTSSTPKKTRKSITG